jgi:hypothetical protein
MATHTIPNKPSPERAAIRKRVDELPISPIHVKMMLQTIRKLNREIARLRYLLSI